MPYVSLYKVIDSGIDPAFRKALFWRQIDLLHHPDWVLIRQDGKRRLPFDDPLYQRGIYQSCMNQPGIAEAYVRGVEEVLESGADGIFVDNVHPYPKCYGPELGLHRHLDPSKDNTFMYKKALRKVYEAVKAKDPRYPVMLNSGKPSRQFIGYGDVLLWESWIFRRPEKTCTVNVEKQCRMHDWKAVVQAEKDWRDFAATGGAIAALTYLPIPEKEKDHAYLSYVCAKLAGFRHWMAACADRQDILRQIYRIDLGMPIGPLHSNGSVLYRYYEKGLVVGNAGQETAQCELPRRMEGESVVDIYSGHRLTVDFETIRVELPADSGRVYLTPKAYLMNCLGEAAGMAQSLALRLEKTASDNPDKMSRIQSSLAVSLQTMAMMDKIKESAIIDPAVEAQLDSLPTALDCLHQASAKVLELEGQLQKGEKILIDEVPTLLKRNETDFGAQLTKDGVNLNAGGARFVFMNEGKEAFFRLGQNRMSLWVGTTAYASERWLHARNVENMRLTKDEPEKKTVQFIVRLYGQNSGREIRDIDVLVSATVCAGIPGIIMNTSLRNRSDKPMAIYWFWNIGGRYHKTEKDAILYPGNPMMVQKSDWYYAHGRKDGGGGLLLTEWTNLGYGCLFAKEKTKTMHGAGDLSIDWTAYVVPGSVYEDDFVRRRLDWYRQYASMAVEAKKVRTR